MLEWMGDGDVANWFQVDFSSFGIAEAERFIEESAETTESRHFAITDQNDAYLGTVSLKHIDMVNRSAEYAISTRRCAHGTGAAYGATIDVLRYAFEELHLHRVFLDVRADNTRAIAFYDKVGFLREGVSRDGMANKGGAGFVDLIWFSMLEEDFSPSRR